MLDESRQEIKDLTELLSQKHLTIAELENKNSNLFEAKIAVDLALSESQNEKADLKAQLSSVREQIDRLSNIESINANTKSDYDKLQENYQEVKKDAEHWRLQNSQTNEILAKQLVGSDMERVQLIELQESLQSQQAGLFEKLIEAQTKQEKDMVNILTSRLTLHQHELDRLAPIEKQYEELKERHDRLVESTERDAGMRKDLQYRLDTANQKWEDLKSRDDFAAGQVTILQEKVTEAKANHMSLNREIKEFKEQVANLKQTNSELLLIGESHKSKETIDDLRELLAQENSTRREIEQAVFEMSDRFETLEQAVAEMTKHLELSSQLARSDLLNLSQKFSQEQEGLTKILSEKIAECNTLIEREKKMRSERDALAAVISDDKERLDRLSDVEVCYQKEQEENNSLHIKVNALEDVIRKLEASEKDTIFWKNECESLRESKGAQEKDTYIKLQSAAEHAASMKKEAASSARTLAIAATEKKYEITLMNLKNDLKKTTRKLADTESRLLAMSAELAKARGKPSLEETFSISDQSECLATDPLSHTSVMKKPDDEDKKNDLDIDDDGQDPHNDMRVRNNQSVLKAPCTRSSKRLQSRNPGEGPSEETNDPSHEPEAFKKISDFKQEEGSVMTHVQVSKPRKQAQKAGRKK
ncbi:hypothetical protein CROQUDRAFT_724594 [Cronartium quercuum f. sp. fusiforme G11]|uniref:Uncharacterized protein n=1 Tax=Cronartium quercuum f. sp. fusiforme G11 TaxID=708437 RepID=A0A9P6T8S0_9BASI|nr:hypothetical protein CROQUDRAFT_724594 [Cronartium quercuum f. sp. fusiforme G11]